MHVVGICQRLCTFKLSLLGSIRPPTAGQQRPTLHDLPCCSSGNPALPCSLIELTSTHTIVLTRRALIFPCADRNLRSRCSFFKTLTNATVTVELKNDISIRGTLKSVDQYLNIKLDDIVVLDELKYPHLSSVKNIFIRGSVVRYVHLPASEVDRGLLEDASRREAQMAKERAR